jgi:DNA-binding beta-propeller fold protein YncE
MTTFRRGMAFLGLFLLLGDVQAAKEPSLTLAGTIELPGVKGRIDHFAIDNKRGRLFVAALGNDTVEVVDLKQNRHEKSLTGFGEPQGIEYLPNVDRVYVANGTANRVDIYDASSLTMTKRVDGLEDADNVRAGSGGQKIFVGYGKGALRMLDAQTGASGGDIALSGHPESFQLEKAGERIYVNVPTQRQVAVIDKAKGSVIATWSTASANANFPMALDESNHRLFVGARKPAVLLIYDTSTGRIVAQHPIGQDTDDIFYDAARKKIYVVCGEGRIDIFRQDSADKYVLAESIKTGARARTGLYVPELSRLFVAAPAAGATPARVLVYKVD